MFVERITVLEDLLLLVAILRSDCITGNAGDGGHRVRDDTTVLDIEPTDRGQRTSWCSIRSDELSHYGEALVGVHSLAGSIEGVITHSV